MMPSELILRTPERPNKKSTFALPPLPWHEDTASNFLHLLLIIVSMFLLFSQRKKESDKTVYFLLWLSLFMFLLFVGYLKWQPWHTRLHMPFFFVSMLLIPIAFDRWKKGKVAIENITIVLIAGGVLVSLVNWSRPLIPGLPGGSQFTYHKKRSLRYYPNRPDLASEYERIYSFLEEEELMRRGFVLGGNHWEYSLIRDGFSSDIVPYHIMVKNMSAGGEDPEVEVIISTRYHGAEMSYNGKIYRDLFPDHSLLWLYYPE